MDYSRSEFFPLTRHRRNHTRNNKPSVCSAKLTTKETATVNGQEMSACRPNTAAEIAVTTSLSEVVLRHSWIL